MPSPPPVITLVWFYVHYFISNMEERTSRHDEKEKRKILVFYMNLCSAW
ncbi:hypothetical protein RchiOBHm_Chr2g0104771 [Rosa chinensis]|uniref:Uncharacterized protein n=1 Tax=Rosa chinensis TaxID=74649 RepID=A0A2P6RN94_ROSCH|nr:hypothetical protein RchiOBHm_Chr2g0104771 [Rosa chinensis]